VITIGVVLTVAFTAVCAVGIVLLVLVARSTRGAHRPADIERLRHLEHSWFVAVTVVLVAVLAATIAFTPYGRSAGKDAQILEVRGLQFVWVIPSTPITAGHQVEFHLTSDDVNHSFAVYTASGEFLFQVQVMPGETQKYVYTFDKPGTYEVLCLEYCGVGHADMRSELKVVAA
jgi:cytochrome c oxidase subunit II